MAETRSRRHWRSAKSRGTFGREWNWVHNNHWAENTMFFCWTSGSFCDCMFQGAECWSLCWWGLFFLLNGSWSWDTDSACADALWFYDTELLHSFMISMLVYWLRVCSQAQWSHAHFAGWSSSKCRAENSSGDCGDCLAFDQCDLNKIWSAFALRSRTSNSDRPSKGLASLDCRRCQMLWLCRSSGRGKDIRATLLGS